VVAGRVEPGRRNDTSQAASLIPVSRPLPRPEPFADRELIVVADDNADMHKYLRHLLDGRYEVHTVSDCRQALETTRLRRPALLLADVMMPQLDGFGLLRAVRDDAVLASTPIILLFADAIRRWTKDLKYQKSSCLLVACRSEFISMS
jgi:CheY-like chemotaxis protein